jgi:uncharacterized protein (TIGR02246 family)
MSPDEQAIREVHSTWIAAVNAADLGCLLSLMTDDVVLLNPGGAPLGRDGFSANFLGAHKQFRLQCISELEEVLVGGPNDCVQFAYTRCRDSLSVTPISGGETTHLAGHRLTIYRKHPDGRWLLARDAHTLTAVGK